MREKSDRKVGGQKGRKGKTLNMVETPDIIETHIPEFCNCCGNNISNMSRVPYSNCTHFKLSYVS